MGPTQSNQSISRWIPSVVQVFLETSMHVGHTRFDFSTSFPPMLPMTNPTIRKSRLYLCSCLFVLFLGDLFFRALTLLSNLDHLVLHMLVKWLNYEALNKFNRSLRAVCKSYQFKIELLEIGRFEIEFIQLDFYFFFQMNCLVCMIQSKEVKLSHWKSYTSKFCLLKVKVVRKFFY